MSLVGDASRLAVGTLTVLPVPPPRQVTPRVAGLAMVLAPVAVLPLAAAAGLLVWAGSATPAPPLLTAVLTVALLALGSRGLHLDGLADTADGLGVPVDAARRLEVMRRGDVGPVGASALVLVLGVQAAALAGVVDREGGVGAALAVGLAVVASRACLVVACRRGVPAARADGLGSAVAGSVPSYAVAAVLLAVGLAAWPATGPAGVLGVAAAAAVTLLVVLRARARFGGVTGDVMGAGVEVSLAACLVVLAVAA